MRIDISFSILFYHFTLQYDVINYKTLTMQLCITVITVILTVNYTEITARDNVQGVG